jgi:hypothetical protein
MKKRIAKKRRGAMLPRERATFSAIVQSMRVSARTMPASRRKQKAMDGNSWGIPINRARSTTSLIRKK